MIKQNIVKLRNVNKNDFPHFLKWWRDKELVKLTSGVFIESESLLKSLFNKMFSKRENHFVIIYNEKIIGNVSLTPKNKSTFEIHIVIGEKKYRGQGLGVLAINNALSIGFNRLGYKNAYLEVRPDNISAIRAYEKCGFSKIGYKEYKNNKNQPLVLKMALRSVLF